MRFSYGNQALMRDLSRCYGDLGKEVCEDREQCLRFLTMRIDLPDVLSYVLTLRCQIPRLVWRK